MKHFAVELLNRGHELTCVTNKPLTGHNSSKYTEILIDPTFNLSEEFSEYLKSTENKNSSKIILFFYL